MALCTPSSTSPGHPGRPARAVRRQRSDAVVTALGVLLAGAAVWTLCVGDAPGQRAPYTISLLLAPALEEVVFRLGLQESLLRRGWQTLTSAALVAAAFSAAHLLLRGADLASAATALPALAIGLRYGRHRSVPECVLAHAACNALWLWAGAAPLLALTTALSP
jgi:membrane protease YdiL (CAAX protease family)